jgi:hypothetical protein
MPYRLAEVPEDIQDRMFERNLPIKWIRIYGQRTIDEKPDRIQNHICRIWVDGLLCWVLGQARSSQCKLSGGTNNIFEQNCIIYILEIYIDK